MVITEHRWSLFAIFWELCDTSMIALQTLTSLTVIYVWAFVFNCFCFYWNRLCGNNIFRCLKRRRTNALLFIILIVKYGITLMILCCSYCAIKQLIYFKCVMYRYHSLSGRWAYALCIYLINARSSVSLRWIWTLGWRFPTFKQM